MTFTVGQQVDITRFREPLRDAGQVFVTKVSQLKVVLSDGSVWRASDGYEWGKKLDGHFGRASHKRIRPTPQVETVKDGTVG